MPSDRASNEIRKSMAYDLLMMIEKAEKAGQQSYTMKEIKNLIDTYIVTTTSKS